MNLTKEQIKYIDSHLKKNGIKYWDLRIEMIDHIVTDIEINASSEDFKRELTASLTRIGLNGNLRNTNIEGWQNVNRKYRKMYHKGFIDYFKSVKNVIVLIICFGAYYYFSEKLLLNNFTKLSKLLFTIPIVFYLYNGIKIGIKRYGKSVNLDYGLMYLMIAFMILQGIPIIFRGSSESTQIIVWLVLMPIYFIATYSGYRVFKKALNKVEKMREELFKETE